MKPARPAHHRPRSARVSRSRSVFRGALMPQQGGRAMRKFAVLILSAAMLAPFTFAAIALAGDILGFTEEVSPSAQLNATEPSVAVDRSDGTIYVAWQATGTHAARSDDGGRTFVQLSLANPPFGRDLGDVAIRVGGATPCTTPMPTCLPGAHPVYISALERLPLPLQTHLFF